MWNREDSFPSRVKFHNCADAATIRQIEVEAGRDGTGIKLSIIPSSINQDEVFAKCKLMFKKKEIRFIYEPKIVFQFESITSITIFSALLKYFDNKYSRKEYSKDLISDIEKIYQYYQFRKCMPVQAPKLTIPEPIISKAQVDPDKKDSTAIINLMNEGLSTKKIDVLLMSGHNPNQKSRFDETPLYMLTVHTVKKIIRVENSKNEREKSIKESFVRLICYGANFLSPLSATTFHSQSVFEAIYPYRNDKMGKFFYEFMMNAINFKTTQALKQSMQPKTRIKYFEVIESKQNSASIKFQLSNQESIVTSLVSTENISHDDRIKCNEIYNRSFKDQKEFDLVFSPQNNVFINLIYYQLGNGDKQLIGFTALEVLFLDDKFSFHVWYIAGDCSCPGFIPLVSRSLAKATQLAFPDNTVACYYNPVHYRIVKMMGATEFASTPKYQSPSMVSLVDNIHANAKTFQQGAKFIHDGIRWCVLVGDSSCQSKKPNKPTDDPNETLHETEFKVPGSEAIVCNLISDDSYDQFQHAASDIGIDSKYAIEMLAKMITPMMEKLTHLKANKEYSKNWNRAFCEGLTLFYSDQRKPSPQGVKHIETQKRAML